MIGITGFGCSICNGTNADIAQGELLSLIEREGWFLSDNFTYVNSTTKIDITCPKGHLCSITPKNFKKGRRCPTCATYGFDPSREACFYIQQVNDGAEIIAYKYGITCRTPEARMNQQSRVNKFTHSLIYSLNNANGQKVLELENYIKRSNLPSCYLPKEMFPDGFTETIPPYSLDNLIAMVNEYISSDRYILE